MPKGSILVVDHNADDAAARELVLHGAGLADTNVITDLATVMEACARHQPDLVLLDLQMFGTDGFEILRLLRNSEAPLRHVPVLVTADNAVEMRNTAFELGAKDFLGKPYDPTELVLRVKNLLETRFLYLELQRHNEDLEQGVRHRTRDLWAAVQGIEKTEQEVRRSREETIRRLAIAAEFRDDETPMHVHRMSRYCALLARKAGQDQESADVIRLASVMHDVGKIGIPDSIVFARGRLSREERRVMQKHTEIGFTILTGSDTPLLDLAACIALTHHERFDGSGYPRGLQDVEIPLEGRIAAIADVFDALTTDRHYRRRFELTEAVSLMMKGRTIEFDPDLLDLFLDSLDEVLKIKEENEDAA